jgi:hypothetical protein
MSSKSSPATIRVVGPDNVFASCKFVKASLLSAWKIILWSALLGPQAMGKVCALKIIPVKLSIHNSVTNAV